MLQFLTREKNPQHGVQCVLNRMFSRDIASIIMQHWIQNHKKITMDLHKGSRGRVVWTDAPCTDIRVQLSDRTKHFGTRFTQIAMLSWTIQYHNHMRVRFAFADDRLQMVSFSYPKVGSIVERRYYHLWTDCTPWLRINILLGDWFRLAKEEGGALVQFGGVELKPLDSFQKFMSVLLAEVPYFVRVCY